MRTPVAMIVLSALVLSLSAEPVGAQSVKLRPLSPVYVDHEGSPLDRPEGIGCGTGSDVIVADTGNDRLVRYTVSEETIRSVSVIQSPQLSRPLDAEILWGGQIIALDGKVRQVVRFDAEGRFVGPLDLSRVNGKVTPRSVALGPKELLFMLDIYSERVIAIDSAGELQREISFPPEYGAMADLAVDSRGRVFVVDSVGKRVFTADSGAESLSALPSDLTGKADFPTSIAVDGSGHLYVGDQNGGSILVLGLDGTLKSRQSKLGWKPGMLRYPTRICIDARDHLYVADRANNRIQVFGILR